jgi:tRNA pseudouridine55 synthase
MKDVVLLDKPVSYTPLQAIEEFKKENPKYNDEKMSYAGRLDPMAEGLLVCLVGKENKNREKYQKLDKTYEFEILFGLATDTYDVMGLLQNEPKKLPENLDQKIKNNLDQFRGKFKQKFPPYSSYRIDGKPLFWWARENKLDEIELPEKEVEVKKLKYNGICEKNIDKVVRNVVERVEQVQGDFRQEKIIEKWRKLKEKYTDYIFKIGKFKTKVSSGTYVRGIADRLGKEIEALGLAWRIKRFSVGKFSLKQI